MASHKRDPMDSRMDGSTGPETKPAPTDVPVSKRQPASRWYLIPSFAIIAASLAALYWGYHQAAIPPGGDSGHWITVSRAFVGMSQPPGDFTLQPFLYPPLVFPFLGVTLLATGSPIMTGFLFGGFLLAAYGLSVIHLSRHFLLSGPFQVLFVGLAVLNGTTLQILFWGGYPNFLAFVFFNEGLVFLLAFARTRSTRDGLLLYVIASLLFLTHDLTFVLFVATLLTTALFLLAQDRRWWRLFASRPNLYGILLLGGTVVTYTVATGLAGISHPGYLFANPAAFQIDNLGELFRLLGYAPLWFPIGPPVALDPVVTLAILLAAAAGVFATSLVVRRFRPAWVPPRLTIGLAVVVATLLVPAGGYLLHVDTDYPRFVFFLALPLALVASLLAERVGGGWLALGSSSSTSAPPPNEASEQRSSVSSRRRRWSLSPRARQWAVHAGIFAVLALIFVGVILPTVALSEKAYATPTHDAAFVSAMNWLRSQNTTGAVLADSADTQRWVQALTDRNAVSAGPTWLHFYSSQVLSDEESFWAENAHYVISDNQAAISVSGYSTPWLNQSPMYSVFVDGVVFPVLRISTTSLAISGANSTGHSYLDQFNETTWKVTTPVFSDSGSPSLSVGFSTQHFWINETSTVGVGGAATIAITGTSPPHWKVTKIAFELLQPQVTNLGNWYPISSLSTPFSTEIYWTLAAHVGQLPGVYPLNTTVTLSKVPTGASTVRAASVPVGMNLSFQPPPLHSSQSFTVTVNLSTPGTSNPATTFPTYFDTESFLTENNIRFFVLQNILQNSATMNYFESEFGFQDLYQNSGWTVLGL